MTGICSNGHITHWRNTRGSRKPETCGECALPVHLATYSVTKQGYELAVRVKRPPSTLEKCALCERKRRVPSGNAKRLERDTAFKVWNGNGYEPKEIKAGAAVCWSHQTWPDGQYISLVQPST